MIWAILILLGIPLWLIALALVGLLRVRGKVRQIPGSFDCKVRPAEEPGTSPERFPRYTSRAHWVHDVLVVHGGSPFLIRTTPHGVTDLAEGTVASGSEPRLKSLPSSTVLHLRTDSGAAIDLACAAGSVPLAAGPFGDALAGR